MIISVASGKGGTGKTTVAVNLVLALKDAQFLDCDVEEPNAHIFLKPRIRRQEKVFIPVPGIDKTKCSFCGRCGEVCAYHAIAVVKGEGGNKGEVLLFPHLCHGCGACGMLCPRGAIREVKKEIGTVESGSAGGIRFVGGRLNVGEAFSPPVIRRVKGYLEPAGTAVIDAPPGTSCPVIEAVKGSDFCVLVTEPTPFGLHDLSLAIEVLRKMKIAFGVVVNRFDIGDGKVEEYCVKEGIPVLMRIPFERKIAEAYARGMSLISVFPDFAEEFIKMRARIGELAEHGKEGR